MLFLILTYAAAPFLTGHGMVPMIMLFLLPAIPTKLIALQCTALATIIGSCFWLRKRPLAVLFFRAAGTVALYFSWIANTFGTRLAKGQTERTMAIESMVIMSLPFQVVTMVVLILLVLDFKRVVFEKPS